MTFKLKIPKIFQTTKSKAKTTDFAGSYANVLYIESLIMLFEKIDDGTTEMLRQKVNDYLAQYDNNYEEAKKHLFADFETQVKKNVEASGHLSQTL